MPIRFRRLTAVLLALALAVLVFGAAQAAEPGVVALDILLVNDFHGALAASGGNPGAAVLAAYLQAEKAKNPAGTLLLSGGDMFQGSPDSNLLHGKTVVAVMNSVGFDAMTLGNHEFDWGVAVLKDRIAQAAFPLLAANIVDKASGGPVDFVRPYTFIERQGVKIAVVGLITPDTAVTTNPRHVENYTFADPGPVLAALIPELRRQGADLVVALCHLASYPDVPVSGEAADLVRAAPGVDVVLSAHSHLKVSGDVAGVPVVQAYYNGRSVAKVAVAYSRASRTVLGATTAVADTPALAPDPRVAAIVAASQAEIAPVKNVLLGRSAAVLPHDRHQLSPLGRWAADAMRAAAGTDIAFQNGGGLRAGLPAGVITLGDLYAVLPFDNTLQVAEMTGAQVLAALEHGIANPRFGMLQFSGLTVEYSAAAPPGRRVTAAVLEDGTPIQADRIYTVAVNDFLVAGGDDYVMVKAALRHTDTFRPLRDILAEAVRKAGIIRAPGDGRLKQVSARNADLIAA